MKTFVILVVPKNLTLSHLISADIQENYPSATVKVLKQTNKENRIISVTMTGTQGNYNALFMGIRSMDTVKTITVYTVE